MGVQNPRKFCKLHLYKGRHTYVVLCGNARDRKRVRPTNGQRFRIRSRTRRTPYEEKRRTIKSLPACRRGRQTPANDNCSFDGIRDSPLALRVTFFASYFFSKASGAIYYLRKFFRFIHLISIWIKYKNPGTNLLVTFST